MVVNRGQVTLNLRKSTMDQLASMRIFLAVAEANALNGAARQLGLSPSAVSKHVAALENQLGTQLFTRTTRHIALTEVGATYLENCRQILADLDKADAEARSASGTVQGHLRVEAPPGFAHRHVAPHLPAFLKQFPHLTIELKGNDIPNDMIGSGFDLSIRVSPQSDHDHLVYTELAPNSRRLVATPKYLAEKGIPKNPNDLARHQLITQSDFCHFKNDNGKLSTIRVRGNIMADNGDAIIRAVMNDGGIAMLPNYMTADYLRDESLTTVLDQLVMEDHPIHAVTVPSRHSIPKIDAFLAYLRSLYQPVPYWDALDAPPSEAARRANI
jgi:DNA-binding transcriptional LysR family regulator